MDKTPFVPPPPVDSEIMDTMAETIAGMTEEERLQFRRGDHLTPYARDKYLRRLEERKNENRKRRIREWWSEHWLEVVGIAVSVIGVLVSIIFHG